MPVLALIAALLGFLRRTPPSGGDDDVALVGRALAGQAEAARALVARLGPVIRARVLRMTGGRPAPGGEDLDDLVAEVWSRLWEHGGQRLRAFDPARGKTLEGYVSLVAGQLVQSRARAALAEKRGGGRAREPLEAAMDKGSAHPHPEEAALEAEDLSGLWAHLEAGLSARGRLVLRLVYVDALTVPEVAAALGVNAQVIYNWQHRIRSLAAEWERER